MEAVDQVDAQGPGGVSPSVGATDHGDNGKTWGRQRVGVTSGSEGDVSHGAPTHRGVHQEAVDNHSRKGGLPPRLCTV